MDATSFVQMWNDTIGAEELAVISSYQTLSEEKIGKVINILVAISDWRQKKLKLVLLK